MPMNPGLVLAWSLMSGADAADPALLCHAGAYRLEDGTQIDVVPGDPGKLRWRMFDGRSGLLTGKPDGEWTSTLGWTGRPDGIVVRFGACADSRMAFGARAGRKLAFDILETKFEGAGETLRGRLVLPQGAEAVPVAVLVHGSESYSAVESNHRQYLLPAHGIGAFVYDKRGTGRSTGKYSQDFHLLAADASAALGEARRLAAKRARSVGFDGGSQAGWIAPLAAVNGGADFVAIGFGLAEGPLAEDREQVMRDLAAAGHGPEVLAKAREVTDATGAIMASGFQRGFDELDAARAKYAKEPWWAAMRGEFTGELAAQTGAALRAAGTTDGSGTTWNYDPMPALRKLEVPLLWVLAGEDNEAPIAETRARLSALARQGKPITLAVFPRTDHGIVEFETDTKGARKATRYADGYFRMLTDWLRTQRLDGPYGGAKILFPPQRARSD
ncbi:MAG: alpha/beta hydrolase family protein [Steroidobacteraceae bacterium]